MSLFDLQDVCIAIGSIATLDLPMVVDLIGIYGLNGPYCTLTTTNWFLQALSVIPRGPWGDVSRRFTMIRWANTKWPPPSILSKAAAARRAPPPPPRVAGIRSGQFDEENPFVQNLSVLLVQDHKGVLVLVVDRIGDIYRSLPRRADVIVTTVGARHKCHQDQDGRNIIAQRPAIERAAAFPNHAKICARPPGLRCDQTRDVRGSMRDGRASVGRLSRDKRARWISLWRRRGPPLRRVSGDVVTAGLNSSRVWFGPVPGSP
ncbi:hypothetical protein F511_12236 [Dorcoceras hygrometricum]|uniref:Acyl-CoA dehydrogenase-related protein n=1 Tax=Dorcoceras hygrometricum TaxID=472368 RepID=A0A2Z7B2G3_9LAMI|nr:hypothetical protein F511_12236 [Dorcoceras hygrometricum]